MKRSVIHRLALLSAVVLAMVGASAAGQAPPSGGNGVAGIVLVGGTLIDGRGGVPVRDSVVFIRDRRIEAVGTVAATGVGLDRRPQREHRCAIDGDGAGLGHAAIIADGECHYNESTATFPNHVRSARS